VVREARGLQPRAFGFGWSPLWGICTPLLHPGRASLTVPDRPARARQGSPSGPVGSGAEFPDGA